ncbi:FadR/GntR family transcriptional regulator [Erythrobacter aureus]|uniref:FadR family transcriptional regulator n=1 Tax=Erythrobacter aureus TaxID=2182384 RepID=A0A345YHA2_9SPHN|nr:FadR/GntR family transcriptional regulator [Erythrobacter aureus]AXK43304.1 FadR family transcriptional regulator [Erythrobacter aureus]
MDNQGTSPAAEIGQPGSKRLYQSLARRLMGDLEAGRYTLGERLPAERDLAQTYDVSRPTVREAIIALEVQGLVEVRVGSGAYVVKLPGDKDNIAFGISAFELTEARLLIEGEAAALAATQISPAELDELRQLVAQIDAENAQTGGKEDADRKFHLAIAAATRNTAVIDAVARLWAMRETSKESALLHAKARVANVKPVVDEHSAILAALEANDPKAARAAMRAHLSAVLDSLLFATEEQAVAQARQDMEQKRQRYQRAIG